MTTCTFCSETLQGAAYQIRSGRLVGIYHFACVLPAQERMDNPPDALTTPLPVEALRSCEELMTHLAQLRLRIR